MNYPRPLYDRAVEAYLQEFADRNGLERSDIHHVGPKEYSMYGVDPWECPVSLDDIRLDVDGLTLSDGTHIDTQPCDVQAWNDGISGTSQKMNYLHWLMKKYLR